MLDHVNTYSTFDDVAEAMFEVDEHPVYNKWGIEATGKKMLIKKYPEEYLSIVNDTYNVIQNAEILNPLHEQMLEVFGKENFDGSKDACKITVNLAKNGASTFVEYKFPRIKEKIETENGFTTDLMFRAIMKNTFDTSSAATLYVGNIDSFCTNGMILGNFDILRETHRGKFEVKNFSTEFLHILDNYQDTTKVYADMAQTRVYNLNNVRNLFDKLIHKSKVDDPEWVANRKEDHASDLSNKLFAQYKIESEQRGHNIFSIMSAMTNFSSHGQDGLFAMNKQKNSNDNVPVKMFNRESRVSKWLASNTWKEFCVSHGLAA